jgi:hypothetical protein
MLCVFKVGVCYVRTIEEAHAVLALMGVCLQDCHTCWCPPFLDRQVVHQMHKTNKRCTLACHPPCECYVWS